MRVQDVMTQPVETVSARDLAQNALRRMRDERIRHLVATRDGKVVGIVSERDLRALDSSSRETRLVEDLMTSPAVTAEPETTLREAANLLRGRSIGCLPVIQKGKLVGIVTITDLLELIGRGAERPVAKGKRWIMKGRGPRRKNTTPAH